MRLVGMHVLVVQAYTSAVELRDGGCGIPHLCASMRPPTCRSRGTCSGASALRPGRLGVGPHGSASIGPHRRGSVWAHTRPAH
eukprot:10413-Chlamydomonas_euryale.AAC.2